MFESTLIYDIVQFMFPLECMEARFMQKAMIALILLAPMTAAMGVQVINFRMAFFADAISHSAFTGVAAGLVLLISPRLSMPVFALIVGLGIILVQRRTNLSSDTVIGVFFSALIALGLAVVSREANLAREMQKFLYGDILTIDTIEIYLLSALFVFIMLFQIWSYNRLLYIGISPMLATVHRVNVATYQYTYAALLSLVVIFSVWAVGVLLVTALLIVPAAAARNMTRTAGGMFWWSILISVNSSTAGLIISAQDWARTATGATIILVSFAWFIVSLIVSYLLKEKQL